MHQGGRARWHSLCQTGAESVGMRGTRHSRGDVCALAIAIAIATAGAALCPPAHAADLNATANAAVVRPNTLIKTDDLDFGTLLSGPAGGSVPINPVPTGPSAAGGATPVGNARRRAGFPGPRGLFPLP